MEEGRELCGSFTLREGGCDSNELCACVLYLVFFLAVSLVGSGGKLYRVAVDHFHPLPM